MEEGRKRQVEDARLKAREQGWQVEDLGGPWLTESPSEPTLNSACEHQGSALNIADEQAQPELEDVLHEQPSDYGDAFTRCGILNLGPDLT